MVAESPDLPTVPAMVGVLPLEQRAELSGLAFLQLCLAGDAPAAPMAGLMAMRLAEVEVGRVVFHSQPCAEVRNVMGTAHAGYAMTLMDSCMACAVHSTLPVGRGYTTVEVKTNLVKAIRPDGGLLYAEGKVVQVGRRIGTAEGRLTDAAGTLYAFATTTCLIFDLA